MQFTQHTQTLLDSLLCPGHGLASGLFSPRAASLPPSGPTPFSLPPLCGPLPPWQACPKDNRNLLLLPLLTECGDVPTEFGHVRFLLPLDLWPSQALPPCGRQGGRAGHGDPCSPLARRPPPGEDVAKPLQPAHKGPSLPLLNPVISGVQGGQWPLVLARDQGQIVPN